MSALLRSEPNKSSSRAGFSLPFLFSEQKLYGEADYIRLSGGNELDKAWESGLNPFRDDYARLLRTPSFRRLQGKTQLFPGTESDFFRNRLTHSLEVAQVASGIASFLNEKFSDTLLGGARIDLDLVQFAAIAHDLGHPPFGHKGEKALDLLMRNFGGFEGNAQTLRILATMERKLIRTRNSDCDEYGLNLTYRALASVLKYDRPIPFERAPGAAHEKGYYLSEASVVHRIKTAVAPGYQGPKFKTIECSIMDIADDIAYSTYDLEDSLHAGFVSPYSLLDALHNNNSVRRTVTRKCNDALIKSGYMPLANESELTEALAAIFSSLQLEIGAASIGDPAANLAAWARNRMLNENALIMARFTAERVSELTRSIELIPDQSYPQLSSVRLSREGLIKVEVLKHLNYELVIRSPRLAIVEHRGHDLVRDLFNALNYSNGALLPDDWRERYECAVEEGEAEGARIVCDYVASMTDRYAAEMHGRLFGKGESIFKPL